MILSLLASVLSIFAGIGKLVLGLFSAERQLKKREVDEAYEKGQTDAEAQRLEDAYERIEHAPPPPDVTEDLNQRFGR